MILLYYGQDTWSLNLELKKLKEKFLTSHPEGAIEEIVCDPQLTDELLRQLLQQTLLNLGLFSKNKFVLIRGILEEISNLKNSEAFLSDNLEKLGKNITVLFLEPGVFDKRLKLFKKLQKIATLKEFIVPQDKALVAWIQKRVADMDCEIAPEACGELISRLGEQVTLWQIENELQKLMLFARESKTITADQVRELVATSVIYDVFALTNLVAEGNVAKAVAVLERMVTGANPLEQKTQIVQIIGALASQMRSLLLVKSLEGQSTTQIAKTLGWKDGRVYINLKLSAKFSEQKLIQSLKDLKAIDFRLKTSEEPPKLLLSLFLHKAKV